MERERELREIREAIEAGLVTKNYLVLARESLDSAAGFGIADMLGMDFIGGIGKHMKMRDAQGYLEQAQRQVERFQAELKDVNQVLDMKLTIDGFLSFADFFLDGLFVDFYVQSKISDAKRQVDNGICQVERILDELYQMESRLL